MDRLSSAPPRVVKVLLVEDNEGDIRLTKEALKEGKLAVDMAVVRDGVEAMHYLGQKGKHASAARPDLILLDLNMPRKDGRQTLAEIKADQNLKTIPVVILTTSSDDMDVVKSYDLHANCFVTKPMDMNQFIKVVSAIEDFWFTVVKLPPFEARDV